jgi:magnesium chelatase family protein
MAEAGLIDGGHVPMPGDVSLAHHGVRFLDELTLLGKSVNASYSGILSPPRVLSM